MQVIEASKMIKIKISLRVKDNLKVSFSKAIRQLNTCGRSKNAKAKFDVLDVVRKSATTKTESIMIKKYNLIFESILICRGVDFKIKIDINDDRTQVNKSSDAELGLGIPKNSLPLDIKAKY